MINSKKGAMFGLDARIALAIFGALSVISGAALYSAIQGAKSETWRQYLREVVKASESFYLDVGENLPRWSPTQQFLNVKFLHENNTFSGYVAWRGPYLTDITNSSTDNLKNSLTAAIHEDTNIKIRILKGTTWPSGLTSCVVNDSDCYEWISIEGGDFDALPALEQLCTQLDAYIDNSDGKLAGSLRCSSSSSGYILYKGMPRKRLS